jgi:hypothetical protein
MHGSDVGVQNIKISNKTDTMNLPEVLINNPKRTADGTLTADSITFNNGDWKTTNTDIRWQAASVSDVLLPANNRVRMQRLPFFLHFRGEGLSIMAKH